MYKKKAALFVLFFLSFFTRAESVLAHATPITYEPEASSVLEILPNRVEIYFSERIEPGASGIAIFGPNGSRVDNNDASVDVKDAHYFRATVKDSGGGTPPPESGTYTVSWQVVSADDGHFTKGAFSFSVGEETGASMAGGQIQIQHITTIPQAITIGIELTGQAMLLGALILFAFLWRPLRKRFGNILDTAYFEKKFTVIIVIATVLIIIGVASFVIIKTFDLQQLRPANFPATLGVFLDTTDGSFALYRALLALAIGIVFFLQRRSIFASDGFTKAEGVLLFFLLLMLLARARVSHAAASHIYPLFSIFVNFLHLGFKGFWVGGLIILSTLFLPLLARVREGLARPFVLALFSKLCALAFGGTAITGAYIVWLHLKNTSFLFSTEWGFRFIILFFFALVLFSLRLWHQLVADKGALNLSRYTLPLETLVGITLLFITSHLIITTPPLVPAQTAFEKKAISQGAEITLALHPFESGQLLITVLDAMESEEASLTDIVVTLTNEEKGIGPIVAKTEERFLGGYVFPASSLTPQGVWNIGIAARREGFYDAVASFSVDYPQELETAVKDSDSRSFGAFEATLLTMAFGSLILTLFLFHYSKGEVPSQTHETLGRSSISWISAGALLAGVSFLIFIVTDQFIKTDFQKLCERNGHFWLQSAPMRDGRALSSDTVTGCFLDVGLYHFADEREYRFFFQEKEILAELSTIPENLTTGTKAMMTVSLSELQDGKRIGPARDIGVYHDRILHAIIVGEDLTTFAHIHPEDEGPITDEARNEARFTLSHTFPKSGRYLINVDFVASGRELSRSFVVHVFGEPEMEQVVFQPSRGVQTKEFKGYEVTLSSPQTIKAGERVRLNYSIKKDGQAVKNLEPYLAAAMHIAIVRQDFSRFTHTHGEAFQPGSVWFQQVLGKYVKYHTHFAPDQFGPEVITQPWTTIFPSPGAYQVFGEFKHEGEIIVTHFAFEVSA